MGCGGGCGGSKRVTVRRNSPMSKDTVRLMYTGVNTGPIPFKCISGAVYRGSATTYRFADVLPEDVSTLVGSGKWRVLERPVKQKPAEVVEKEESNLTESDSVPVFEDEVETKPSLDTSTIKKLEESLKSYNWSLDYLINAYQIEENQEKPRSGIKNKIDDAIKNHPDSPGNL